ncbi:alpha/beta hydrolase [Curtobacterium sp. MCBD17_013]|uniref:alpha/beta hydrolase n=1 Tax=Curtobacterium sp. MCBD17_013 TaxID=2175668 RepID=UPI000DAA07CB|nr:alpha/beta hydrolase [Curtobacterium sp. MCBD17_013]PZF62977.1 alpha/beta hydrolase [Curtobacterium sp. MCBD17_013]
MTYWTTGEHPGTTERRTGGVLLLIVVAVLAGLIGGAIAAFTTGPVIAHRLVLDEFTKAVHWTACGHDRCAAVEAPLDWEDPGTRAIHLALIEHRATGKRLGTLLVDPGGPGESGVDLVGSSVRNAVTATVARHYDVVGFDPRGVGYSSAVHCGGAAELDRYLYSVLPGTIGSSTWLAADRERARTFAHDCAEHTGALLGHVDTVSAARDMELLRADLGTRRLDYLGYSYGTELGSVYASLYPHHVGRFVLDGAVDIWTPTSTDGVVAQAKGFEGDLRAWARACVRGSESAVVGDATCPFTGTVDHAMSRIRHLLHAADTDPLTASDGRRLDGATLSTAIVNDLYSTTEWPALTTMLRGVAAGDPAKAFHAADAYNGRRSNGKYWDNATEAFTAIGCLDGGADDVTADMRHEAKQLAHAAPTLGRYQAYGDVTCGQWPDGMVASPPPPTHGGQDPVLVIGSTGDPATPYHQAKTLAALFPSGHLVTHVGEGHLAYNYGDECVDDTVDAYLVQGLVPSRDPRCR